jgi:hypothetical protein
LRRIYGRDELPAETLAKRRLQNRPVIPTDGNDLELICQVAPGGLCRLGGKFVRAEEVSRRIQRRWSPAVPRVNAQLVREVIVQLEGEPRGQDADQPADHFQ